MDFITGSSKTSWQPVMTTDTTTPSYWLNWRVLLCSIWILTSLVLTFFIISKYEGPKTKSRETPNENEPAGTLYEVELWKPCFRGIHPAWLLGYRLVAFFVLLIMLILNVAVDGGSIMDYYTQWTFTLITVYFGLGSLISMHGCNKYHNKVGGDGMGNLEGDAELATWCASVPSVNNNAANSAKNFGPNEVGHDRQIAGFWGYAFQVIFQMNAGAVMLTDAVFWCIIVPFLALKDYDLNFVSVLCYLKLFINKNNLMLLSGSLPN